jgi:hypothetical protein
LALSGQPLRHKTPTTTCRRRRDVVQLRPCRWQITPPHRLRGSGGSSIRLTGLAVIVGRRRSVRQAAGQRLPSRSIPGRIRELPRNQSPSLREPTGAHFSQSSTMPATLCKAMYLSAVMKVPSSRGSCTSRSHPHFSHASDIHWGGSDPVVMPTSLQNLARRRDPWRWRSCATIALPPLAATSTNTQTPEAH